MGYYIRVLSPNPAAVAPSLLEKRLTTDGCKATISGDVQDSDWQQLIIAHADGREVCMVERYPVASTEIGRDEIDGFLEEIDDCQPRSAAQWLASYLPTVETVYILPILSGTYEDNGWDIVGSVKTALWNHAGGIIQADFEGFSNEDGYHILWQFSDTVTGDWQMAVLADEKWVKFQMDLGNPDHRASFQHGKVPRGVAIID